MVNHIKTVVSGSVLTVSFFSVLEQSSSSVLSLISSITFHTVTQRNVPQGLLRNQIDDAWRSVFRTIQYTTQQRRRLLRAVPQEIETVFLAIAPLWSTNHSEAIAT